MYSQITAAHGMQLMGVPLRKLEDQRTMYAQQSLPLIRRCTGQVSADEPHPFTDFIL